MFDKEKKFHRILLGDKQPENGGKKHQKHNIG